jgi:hypothetical protein
VFPEPATCKGYQLVSLRDKQRQNKITPFENEHSAAAMLINFMIAKFPV